MTGRQVLEGAATLVTLAMRLSPIERDLLIAGLFLVLCKVWSPANVKSVSLSNLEGAGSASVPRNRLT